MSTRREIFLRKDGGGSFASIVDFKKASSSTWSSEDSSTSVSNEQPPAIAGGGGFHGLITTGAIRNTTKTTTPTRRSATVPEQSSPAITDTIETTQQRLLGPHPTLREESQVKQHNQPSHPSPSPKGLKQENDRLREEVERLRKQMRRLKRSMGAQQQTQNQSAQIFSLQQSPTVSTSPATGPLLELPLILRQGQQAQYKSDSDTGNRRIVGTNLACFKNRTQQRQSLLSHVGVNRDEKDHQSEYNSDDDQDTIESGIGVDIDVYQSASGLIRRSQSHYLSGGGPNYDLVGANQSFVRNNSIEHRTKRTPIVKGRTDRMTEDMFVSSDDGSDIDNRDISTSDDISMDGSFVESQEIRISGGRHRKNKPWTARKSNGAGGGIIIDRGSPVALFTTSTGERPQQHLPFQMTFCQSVADRAGWLVGLLVFQSLSSFILARNESLLKRHTVIVQFLTMLVGAGGNAGNQASVGVVRGLAVGTIDRSNVRQFLMRELAMGVALSLILGLAGFVRAAVFSVPPLETLAITSSLFLIVIISVVAGATLPLGMHLVGIDPAHSSTTIQVIMDITGVVITVGVSSWVLDSVFFHTPETLS